MKAKKILAFALGVFLTLGLASNAVLAEDAGEAFDDYPRPVVVTDRALKVGILVPNLTTEAQVRSLQQFQVEAAHRGWETIEINYETDDGFRDAMQNVMNQEADAIILDITQNMESHQDLVSEARNRGIGVYSNDNQIIDGIIMNSTVPNGAAAMELFYKVAEDYMWNLNVCEIEFASSQVMTSRSSVSEGLLESGTYPNLKLLDAQEITSTGDMSTAGYTITQAWIQRFGDDFQCLIANADPPAMTACEGIIQAGDPTGEKTFVTGFDGGSQVWSYMRSGTPLHYTYAQPFEMYTHKVCEAIDQIQVQGLNPGDEGCILEFSGQTLYSSGGVTTLNNIPEVGSVIHEAFDWYGMNPDDPDAWFNWTDGPGPYIVTDGL